MPHETAVSSRRRLSDHVIVDVHVQRYPYMYAHVHNVCPTRCDPLQINAHAAKHQHAASRHARTLYTTQRGPHRNDGSDVRVQELGGLLGDHNSEKAKCVDLQVRSGRLVTAEMRSTPVTSSSQPSPVARLLPQCTLFQVQ